MTNHIEGNGKRQHQRLFCRRVTTEDKTECLKEMRTSKNWAVWCRGKRKGNEELEEFLSDEGIKVFQGRCGGGKTKGKVEPEEKEATTGRTI